jgi:ATP-dependent Lhr-like helicase
VALYLREHAEVWLGDAPPAASLSTYAGQVLAVLDERGASFFHDLVQGSGLLATQVEQALGELVALGLVTADSFAGLRALLIPSSKRTPLAGARRKGRTSPFGVESAGRWVVLRRKDGRTERREDGSVAAGLPPSRPSAFPTIDRRSVEVQARVLLRRYGVVFRRLLAREANVAPWRDLLPVYRRLEARGEVRGGRFVAGMAGEQFALPEAVGQLRAVRRAAATGDLFSISAADPLNLVGIVTPGERIPALGGNRMVYRDGVPLAAREGGELRELVTLDPELRRDVERALVRRRVSPALRAYLAG